MNRKIALGLLFGGVIAVGSVACDDSSDSSSSGGDPTGNGTLPVACSTIGSDADTATTPWVQVRTLSLPTDQGYNLDGINNAARGGAGGGLGKTIAGCDKVDIKFGLDNSLAGIADTLSDTIDLNDALNGTLVGNTDSSGTPGTLLIEARLTHLSSADVASDPCVGAEVRVNGEGGDVFEGSGALVDHVASVAFGDALDFTVSLALPAASCNGGACNDASLTISVSSPVATIEMNADNTQMQPGSIIGGFVFFEDLSGGYDSHNATGFKVALSEFAADANLTTDITNTAVGAFQTARDLHMNTNGTIGECTAENNNPSLVNRNAVSVALAVDSID